MTGKGDMADAPGPAEPAPASCAPGLAAQPAGGEAEELLRRHCAWLQQRLDAMEEERRDLSRENRLLWQRTADLGGNALRGWNRPAGEEDRAAARDGAASSRKM